MRFTFHHTIYNFYIKICIGYTKLYKNSSKLNLIAEDKPKQTPDTPGI